MGKEAGAAQGILKNAPVKEMGRGFNVGNKVVLNVPQKNNMNLNRKQSPNRKLSPNKVVAPAVK